MTDALTGRLTGSGLEVGYDEHTILSDLDVVMPDGSFTVIVGPNACGKSTLLRTLSRLLAPNAGEVVLDGISNGFIDPSLASNWAGLGSHLGRRGRQREIHLEYTAASNSVSR